MITEDALADCRQALADTRWAEARARFGALVAADDGAAEAWEGLSWACWWLGDAGETLHARERACRAYRDAGDLAAAGRTAAFLACDLVDFRGEAALAAGWLARARRMLAEVPEGPDHGWPLVVDGEHALHLRADLAHATACARQAQRIGRTHGSADVETVGLALEGAALTIGGAAGEGLLLLAESATLAATEPFAFGITPVFAFCLALNACDLVGDLERAGTWCTMLDAVAGGRAGLVQGLCRTSRGRVLTAAGAWDAAEAELQAALADLRRERPALAGGALVRLGELRTRQGRPDEARDLFAQAGALPGATVGLGVLALTGGDAAAGADAAARVLRGLGDAPVAERFPALELLARARCALGDRAAAGRAADELTRTAQALGTPYLRGRAALVAAELALAAGDLDAARCAAEDAVDACTACAAPHEAALGRRLLAQALDRLGRGASARAEAAAAGAALLDLGAAEPAAGAAADLSELSARELEVLRLVARGLSDAQIATELVLSPHTVHRHVANTRTKLRLPSRAAAVGYAARAGML